MEGQWDPIANQMYNSQTQQFSIWKDSVNCRVDVTMDRWTDETGTVVYQVPAGEHITSVAKLEREGGMLELKRKYGTPLNTFRQIVTPANNYRYQVEANQVAIDVPQLPAAIEHEQVLQLALNKVSGRFTPAGLVDRFAELAQSASPDLVQSLEVAALGEEQLRVRSTVVSSHDRNQRTTSVLEVVVDLGKSGNIVSYVRRENARVVETGECQYVGAGGAWVLAHAEIVQYAADGIVDFRTVYDVTPASIRVNEPIDPFIFTWEALDVRKGAHVVDHKTGDDYWYDDAPLHVKLALALAREKEEEAAEAAARARETATAVPAPPEPVQRPLPTPAEPAPAPIAASTARDLGPTTTQRAGPRTERDETPKRRKSAPLPPESRPTTTRPTTTRPAGPAPLPEAAASPGDAVPPAAETAERNSPTTTATVVAISAGCVAAVGIGLWKLARRGTR